MMSIYTFICTRMPFLVLGCSVAFVHSGKTLTMDCLFNKLSFLCLLLLLPYPCTTLPLCTDLRAPVKPKKPLAFCPYNGSVCCNSSKDLQLKQRFDAMNISDAACASAVKSILCATCDQFSAELFKVKLGPRQIPVLCNSTTDGGASSKTASVDNFCSNVWDVCQNTSILDSPFAPLLQNKAGVAQNSNTSKFTDLWRSKAEFCDSFGGVSAEDSVCFSGRQVTLNKDEALIPPKGMCLEKIEKGSYLNMVPHPDGSNRAFFSNQPGKIWLATIPEQDSGQPLGLDESSAFVDLTDEVNLDTTYGMMGLAFHPNFSHNGRFFASYNCDKTKSPGCTGRCACNSDVGCDPAKIVGPATTSPCQEYAVVAEFSANGTAPNPSMAEKANPFEVRRIFTMGIPLGGNHGGQILFGPADGYLYLMMGDGGGKGDPYNFAQNKKSVLGKIMRLDVNNIPSEQEIADLNLWGNYSIPADNPFSEDKDLQPEIWAMGLRNPWRCSFDAERPSYFLCGDTGEDQYEEVDIITKGGNYGWRIFEGPLLFQPQQTPGGNTSVNSIDPIFPVVGYNHSDVNKKVGSAAISGGFFYRSQTDPCLYGSYLFGDLYAQNIWAAAENPKNSGNLTKTEIPFSCAADSPLPCSSVPSSSQTALNYILSFGQDNQKDVFILTMSGVYRVVRPGRCNYSCSKENAAAPPLPPPPAPSCSHSPGPLLKLVVSLNFFLCVFCRFYLVR